MKTTQLIVTLAMLMMIGLLPNQKASAQLLFEENFSYATGQLTSVGGGADVSGGNWVNYSGTSLPLTVSAGSLTYTGYASSGIGNKVEVMNGSAEDAYRQFTTQSPGVVIYAACIMNVSTTTGLAANSSSTGDYTVSLLSSTSTTALYGRISLRAGSVANTFNLGMRATSSNTAAVWDATDYPVGTPVLLVIEYDLVSGNTNDTASLFINPVPGAAMPMPSLTQASALTTDPSDIARISIRQGTNSFPGQLDGIRVATTWADAVAPGIVAPTATFNPADGATSVPVANNITITFSEAVRNIDDSPISTPATLLTLKLNDAAGADVPFTATLDGTNTIFTIDPTSDLANNQQYYVAINPVEDVDNNATSTLSAQFTTLSLTDVTPPVVDTAYAVNLSTVMVVYNEAMDEITAETTGNYTGLAAIGSATLNSSLDTVTLSLSTPLSLGIADTLCIANVEDTAGNALATSPCFRLIYGVIDVTAPTALNAWPEDLNTVMVSFSEAMDDVTAENIANYTGLASVGSATLNTTMDTVTLALSTPLISGIADTLYVQNIEDTTGNVMSAQQMFVLMLDTSTTPKALVITEIMYNPAETNTDSTEFIEIYNNDVVPVDLLNYTLKYSSNSFTFPSMIMNPGDYVLVSTNAAAASGFYGETFIQGNTNGMSNGGTSIVIYSPSGLLVDTVMYDDASPWSTLADEGGYSLSLCDPNLDNNNGANWELGHIFFGNVNAHDVYADPGQGCAVANDTVAPIATHAWLTDFTTVKVRFNEDVDLTSAETEANYTGIGTITMASLNTNADTVTLTLATPMVSGVSDTLYVTGVADTAGNVMSIVYEFALMLDTSSTIYNLVITEIMYNSPEAGIDSLEFIEIYNNDAVAVDLLNYKISYGSVNKVFDASYVLNPGDYVIIAPDKAAADAFYGISSIQGPTSGISNSGTFIKINSPSGLLVDSLTYGTTAPWPTEANAGGASLTLCDPNTDNTDGNNWSASTNLVGVIATVNVYADPEDGCVPDAIADRSGSNISIYPNPATDQIQISVNSQAASVSIVNHIGMVVYASNEINDGNNIVNTSAFANGVYHVVVRFNDGQIGTKFFVINR